jgi:hypothetical protein
MLRLLEKLFALLVVAPPLYMGVRWLRWYFRDRKHKECEAES